MKFKNKIPRRRLIAIGLNIVSLAGFAGFMIAGNKTANAQHSQFAAERWMNFDDSLDYAQVSCFAGSDTELNTQSVGSLRIAIRDAMTTASLTAKENSRLWIDGYSSYFGEGTASYGNSGKKECSITAVGGDFFLIHDFKLKNGAYFNENDIMQDSAVIDRNLAWQLYGSDEVAGMTFYLNDMEFYVVGVTDFPESKTELDFFGDVPRVYLSYDAASNLSMESYTDIDCYETVIPNPVKNFAYNAIKETAESFGENVKVVQNTNRFAPSKLLKKLKNISKSVVSEKPIAYMWWENAARVTEFKLSFVYLAAMICLIIPVITCLILLKVLYKFLKSKERNVKNLFSALVEKIRVRHQKGKKENLYEKN